VKFATLLSLFYKRSIVKLTTATSVSSQVVMAYLTPASLLCSLVAIKPSDDNAAKASTVADDMNLRGVLQHDSESYSRRTSRDISLATSFIGLSVGFFSGQGRISFQMFSWLPFSTYHIRPLASCQHALPYRPVPSNTAPTCVSYVVSQIVVPIRRSQGLRTHE
jgi:hypothetical protein